MHHHIYYRKNYQPLLPEDKGLKILDFGCAGGLFLQYLHSEGYQNLHGADIYADDNWTNLNRLGIQTTKISDTEEYLKSISNTYDLILVKDVIYYFRDSEVVHIVQLMNAALKPNGQILFEIVNGAMLTGPYVKYKDYRIQLILTEQSITEIINDAGMHVSYIGGNKTPLTGVRSYLFCILNLFRRWYMKLLYFMERGADSQNPKLFSRKIMALARKKTN